LWECNSKGEHPPLNREYILGFSSI